jgi:hypothetical protein
LRRLGCGRSATRRSIRDPPGLAAWRTEVDSAVTEITAARGGTLAWGLPVEPRQAPIVLLAERGQSAYAALRLAELRAAPARCRPIATLLAGTCGTRIVNARKAYAAALALSLATLRSSNCSGV